MARYRWIVISSARSAAGTRWLTALSQRRWLDGAYTAAPRHMPGIPARRRQARSAYPGICRDHGPGAGRAAGRAPGIPIAAAAWALALRRVVRLSSVGPRSV